MNKQELIDELTKYIESLSNARSDYEQGRRDAYKVALESTEKLSLGKPKKPVVPKCFDTDYKKYKYMENNKAEILLTAMGGIYRVSFPSSFRDDLEANAWRTGIKWNKWTRETILWASRNYADFCQAVISGEYEVEKEQPQLNENQQIVLDWLKNDMLDDSDFYNTIYNSRFLRVNGEPHRKENIAFMKLKNKELAQVLQVFSRWAQEQEEAE